MNNNIDTNIKIPSPTSQKESLGECYFCGEKNAKWCKICRMACCIVDHEEHEESFRQTEYLSWHQYYDMEFLGVKF